MADTTITAPPVQGTFGFIRRGWHTRRTSLLWMVVIAFVFRLGLIVIGHTYKFRTDDNHFSFGWEMGSIGRSLALGQGFSNPFGVSTGATAWEPPLYPSLIAAVFKMFGVYTDSSAVVLLALNSIFSALTCIPIFLIAKRSFGESVAVWSAWLWALAPFVMYWCTRWVWETSLAAFLLTLIFWLALVIEDRDGWKPWLAFGLLWGVAALTNTSLLAFLPASGLWAWIRRSKRGRRSFAGVVLASAVFVASIAPWMARDYQKFGRFILIRSNFGAELRIGNGPNADGTWQQYLHPTQDVYEMRRYRQMGEMAYVAARKQEATAFIRNHYPQFIGVSAKRFIYYWAGVPRLAEIPALAPVKNSVFLASSVLALWGLGRALRQRQPGAWLFFWLILCYPAMYYFVFPHPRYRHPIEPELGMLIVYIISEAERKGTRST
jgi:4-amino-4-deoxy-L-arabinose transferase-like glycosyltransferase